MRISDWSSDRVLFRSDDEVGRGESLPRTRSGVGGQGSGGAEGIDALCDQGAELGFHGDVVSRFNGTALYVSAMKGHVGGRRRSEEHTSEVQSIRRISDDVI